MLNLKAMEGSMIHVGLAMFDESGPTEVKLHRVEDAGLWIENRPMFARFIANAGHRMAPKSMVFFLPWHTISYIWGFEDVPFIADSLAE